MLVGMGVDFNIFGGADMKILLFSLLAKGNLRVLRDFFLYCILSGVFTPSSSQSLDLARSQTHNYNRKHKESSYGGELFK